MCWLYFGVERVAMDGHLVQTGFYVDRALARHMLLMALYDFIQRSES